MTVHRGFGVAGGVDRALIADLARAAEEAGFRTFWANDTPNGDGLEALAEVQRATRSIGLGVGVIPVDRKPAAEIGRQIEMLGLDQRRLIVGIGSGGLKQGSIEVVRHAAIELREKLQAKIVIGALGSRMCELSGDTADGALLNWLTPEQLAKSVGSIRGTSAAAGRAPAWVGAYVRVAVAGAGVERLNAEAERYESFPAYAAHFERMGVRAIDTAAYGRPDDIQRRLARFDGGADEIVVRAIAASESLADYLAIIEESSPATNGAK